MPLSAPLSVNAAGVYRPICIQTVYLYLNSLRTWPNPGFLFAYLLVFKHEPYLGAPVKFLTVPTAPPIKYIQ